MSHGHHMIDVSKTQYHKPERGRLSKIGRCTDDGSNVHAAAGPGGGRLVDVPRPGRTRVQLSKADTVALAEAILGRAR